MEVKSSPRPVLPRASSSVGVQAVRKPSSAEAMQQAAELCRELLPGDRIARDEFLGLPYQQTEIREVDLKEFLTGAISYACLEKTMCIRSHNHPSNSEDDYQTHKDNLAEHIEEFGGGKPRHVQMANAAAHWRTGFCGHHAFLNYRLMTLMLRDIRERYPALAEFLPDKVIVYRYAKAGAVVGGGSPDDPHAFVIAGDFAVDSWVPAAKLCRLSEMPYPRRADDPDCVDVLVYDVHSDNNPFDRNELEELLERLEGPGPTPYRGYYRSEDHWLKEDGRTPFRDWSVIHPTSADNDHKVVYICKGPEGACLELDTNLMSEQGLNFRKERMQRSDAAREAWDNTGAAWKLDPMPGTPRRGAPPFPKVEPHPEGMRSPPVTPRSSDDD